MSYSEQALPLHHKLVFFFHLSVSIISRVSVFATENGTQNDFGMAECHHSSLRMPAAHNIWAVKRTRVFSRSWRYTKSMAAEEGAGCERFAFSE
jgi:hypothetical protein